ncbi:mitochondrial distribution and morphology protein 34 [Calycina marina]|uniref:Mitochondrial distribution and morphology protein 34 n=1 Tax=Calycina marina TaxID=1763456 RepID=A0A9P8CDX7_9HELO|nr:mitochondrial distribution and morphology protein 34 [Calycina marina]
MAFNFNWSPLMADADFYERAQEMLTTALNKSPKPPIIVDDILVNELNLGSIPPKLEILEIGDLAEDRFRGIFKMCYTGDAFLTLQTRVQANPLNTYLFSKPSFCSPQPLAASSGLTIPLQITLSEIKLSAFIIVVFSRQKGLTLVFRNDPLESLKVSSTFDSIPFVRDYLQKEIEIQLRTLMMDELPAIIHRLSLRLWSSEHSAKEDESSVARKEKAEDEEVPIDPFSSPPQDAVDARGNVLDANEISSLSLEGGSEIHSLFSQKNLLRLAALNDSHRTLSLFTPSIRETVFRAWAGPSERTDLASSATTPAAPNLMRTQSSLGNSTTYIFNRGSHDSHSISSRPSLVSLPSTTGLSLGSGRSRSHANRKKRNRVINLRKSSKTTDDIMSESGDSDTASTILMSEPAIGTQTITEEPEDSIIEPPRTPSRVRFRTSSIDLGDSPRNSRILTGRPGLSFLSETVPEQVIVEPTPSIEKEESDHIEYSRSHRPVFTSLDGEGKSSLASKPFEQAPTMDSAPGIVEQAWLLKMAGEIARHVHDEKVSRQGFWCNSQREDTPPPAYQPKA